MGNSESGQQVTNTHNFDKYQVIQRRSEGLVLREQPGGSMFILKQFILADTTHFSELQTNLRKHQSKCYQHVLNVLSIEKQVFQNLCSSSFKISAVLQYSTLTLKEEIRIRSQRKKPFTLPELYKITNSLVGAYRELPDSECLRINPQKVHLNQLGVLKLANNLFDGGDEMAYGQFFSPERFQGSMWNRAQQPYFNEEKEMVFCIGMTALSAATLNDMVQCYDYKENCMRLSILEQKILKCQEQYGDSFAGLLAGCLQINPNKRYSSKKLDQELNSNYTEAKKNQVSYKLQGLDISEIMTLERKESCLSFAHTAIQLRLRELNLIEKQCSFQLQDNQKSQASTAKCIENTNKSSSERIQQITSMLSDGSVYSGKIKNGKMEGQGKIMFPTGAFYQGSFENDLISGYGQFFYKEGQPAYQGQWRNDLFHGYGTHYNDTPEILNCPFDYTNFNRLGNYWSYYIGHFTNNAKEGRGLIMLTNRQYFQGNFKDNWLEGPGRFHRRDGSVVEGFWRANRIIR